MQLPRMTTRRWMIAVAIVALLFYMERRRRSFESLAAYHAWPGVASTGHNPNLRLLRISRWHWALARKYRRAAHYPWLPVETDPSPPDPWLPVEPDPTEPQ
jgi:hypothetical protein